MGLIPKHRAREIGLEARNSQNSLVARIKSNKIQKKVLLSDDFKNALRIAIYFPLKGEVDTRKIIRAALNLEKKVALPIISDGKMEFVEIHSTGDISFKQGFKQPKKGNAILKDVIDVIYVPIVAFDSANFRVGFGKGYYDRYLKEYNGKIIGIAFESQKTELIDIERYDVPMDKIITDKL